MPKQTYVINAFHGGINNSADPRDIQDNELVKSTNLVVDEVGLIKTTGSNVNHGDVPVLDNTGAGVTQIPGSGLFYFSHDRLGSEDAGSNEDETGDNYLALYDDSDAQIWIYSLATDDWNDDSNSAENGVINFLGKTTSAAARPSYYSIDGNLRVSSGEFGEYDSDSNINEGGSFSSSDTTLTVDNGNHFAVGNYIKINNEILYVTAKSTNDLTVRRGMFGTKVNDHADDTDIYILNINQWYGYIKNNFFQASNTKPVYTTDKWYNEIQHLRSLDDLGITLESYNANSNSPTSSQISAINKIVLAYWFSTTDDDVGFWQGSYWFGFTPVYIGNQEGPISTVGSSPVQIHKEILNVQLYISHTSLTSTSIAIHPLIDERIIGLKLYIKNFTSDEWFLLKNFDLLEGGEHGWATYNSDAAAGVNVDSGNTLTGFWKTTTTADSLSIASPSNTTSYEGAGDEANTCVVTLNLNESKGSGRIGTIRLSGFTNSPLYKEVDLNDTNDQDKTFNVVNPGVGTHKFIVELLDENFNVMYRRSSADIEITDSGVTTPPVITSSGTGGSS